MTWMGMLKLRDSARIWDGGRSASKASPMHARAFRTHLRLSSPVTAIPYSSNVLQQARLGEHAVLGRAGHVLARDGRQEGEEVVGVRGDVGRGGRARRLVSVL